MDQVRTIKDKIIGNMGYVFIIGGMILGIKFSTNATWGNVIKSEFWRIILIIIIGITVETIVKNYKKYK